MKEFIIASLLTVFLMHAEAQDHNQANYDEAKVPAYTLPDVLKTLSNTFVSNKTTWEQVRRPEILKLIQDNIYGQIPETYSNIKYTVIKEDAAAMNGAAKLREVLIEVFNNNKSLKINLVLFVPNKVKKPVPAFLLINNRGKENTDPTRATKSEFWPGRDGYRQRLCHSCNSC